MRKMRFPRSLNEPTCKITDTASMTKIPPTKNSSISCLMITAMTPNVPPSESEPTSPMNTSAGCALYQRNPSDAPTSAPHNTVNSPTRGMYWISRYVAQRELRSEEHTSELQSQSNL